MDNKTKKNEIVDKFTVVEIYTEKRWEKGFFIAGIIEVVEVS